MDIFRTCLPCWDDVNARIDATREPESPVTNEKTPILPMTSSRVDEADEFLRILRTAKHNGPELQQSLRSIIPTTGWKDFLAEKILIGLADIIRKGTDYSVALKEAIATVRQEACEFSKQHPLYSELIIYGGCILVAIGVLVLMAPWVLPALGFAEEGPVLGE